jgi:hypothetical protein
MKSEEPGVEFYKIGAEHSGSDTSDTADSGAPPHFKQILRPSQEISSQSLLQRFTLGSFYF